MRQKCVKNASNQNGSCFIGTRRTFQNASEMRQNCVKNASKMRGTPLGGNTFWTIPTQAVCVGETLSRKGISLPSLCASQVLDKGIKRAHRWQYTGQPESPISLRRVTRKWSWDISQKQWNFQWRKIRPRFAEGNRAQQIRPKIRPFESDAATSAGTL